MSDLEDVLVLALHVDPVVEPSCVGDLQPHPPSEITLSCRGKPTPRDLVFG